MRVQHKEMMQPCLVCLHAHLFGSGCRRYFDLIDSNKTGQIDRNQYTELILLLHQKGHMGARPDEPLPVRERDTTLVKTLVKAFPRAPAAIPHKD